MIFSKIRIRDVNRYLKPVIKELLAKHGKVTNPDFEDELEQITGIRYRMAKTYTYSPKPWEIIKNNSKIKKFIIERRKKDVLWKLRPFLYISLLIILSVNLYHLFISPQKLNVDNDISINLPTYGIRLKLGHKVTFLEETLKQPNLLNCSPKLGDLTSGHEDIVTCSFRLKKYPTKEPNLKFLFAMQKSTKSFYWYRISSTMPSVITQIRKQIGSPITRGYQKLCSFKSTRDFKRNQKGLYSTTVYQKNDQAIILVEPITYKSKEVNGLQKSLTYSFTHTATHGSFDCNSF